MNTYCGQFSAHKSRKTRATIDEHGYAVAYIPSNTTPLFQPLDVTVNKVFKERVYAILNSEAMSNDGNFRQVIINAVSTVLTTIEEDLVTKGFEKSRFHDFKRPHPDIDGP